MSMLCGSGEDFGQICISSICLGSLSGCRRHRRFQWNDGTIQEPVITNCASIIEGSPYSASGAGTYVGYASNPASGEPFPGETYYVHVVVYGLGNSCAGQSADINVTLPPNTSTAVTGSTPIYCFADGVRDTMDCNQPLQSSAAAYGSGSVRLPANNPSHANTWPLPQGHKWEFQIPVVSTASFISGQLAGHTTMLDGNSSPVLTPTVTYPSSSTAINGANFAGSTYLSTAIIRPNGQGGSFFFDMMSGASVLYSDAGNVPNGTIGDYGVTENWIITGHPLSPSTTYMWRVRFVTATNVTINGGTQSFTTPPTSGGTTTIAAATTTTKTIAAGGGTPGGGTAPTTVAPPTTSPTTTVSIPDVTSEYVPIVPARILETRTDPGSSTVDGQGLGHGFVAAEGTIELQVGGRAGVPGDAGAVALNVTVTNARATGFASVYPCGAARPTTSNLNFVAGQTIPNAVIAELGTDGKVCIFTNVGTHLLADVNGYFPAASSYAPIVPARILETRTDPGSSTIDGQGLGQGIVAGGTEVALLVAGRVGVPNNARAAVLNVTVTAAQGNGYVTVYPCGATRPITSNLNFVAGQTIPNAVIAKIGTDGKVCIYANVGTHLIADVNGYFPG